MKRNLSYDVIRIVALLMIVMVHVSAYMVIFFPDTDNVEWTVGNIFNGISRAGVPMFVLLSGALLLREDKPTDAKKFYKKNLLTMVLLAVGWMIAYGLIYAVVLPLLEGKAVNIADFWQFLLRFKGTEYPHLWYMLMVVGLYLMIPVLRLFVKRENKNYIIGIIITSVIVQFTAQTLNVFTSGTGMTVTAFVDKFHFEPVTGFVGILLIGWYLNEFSLGKCLRRILYCLGIVSVVGSTIAVHTLIDTIPQVRDDVYQELTLTALIFGCSLFVFIQTMLKNKTAVHSWPATLSDSTFGVYLIHILVMEIFIRLILPYENFGVGRPLPYILMLYAFTLFVSYAIVRLVGLIPGVRRIFYTR